MPYYKQVTLCRGSTFQTSYIPEAFAHVGKTLKIKELDGSWGGGWKVVSVGTRLSEEYVLEHEKDFTKHRRGTDAVRDGEGTWVPVK